MIKGIKKIFSRKQTEKRDFSDFFNNATTEEKKKLLEEVVRKANQDQRDLMKEYQRTTQKTA